MSGDALLARYAESRYVRDSLKSGRDACLCERHEAIGQDGTGEACWKAAREWTDNVAWNGEPTGARSFRFNPPIMEWCETCQRRQALTDQLRLAVKSHAAAKRAVLQRGRALIRKGAGQ